MIAAVAAAVFLVAVFLLLALYGAALHRIIQNRRYRVLELRSEARAQAIRTDHLLREVAQREALAERAARHYERRMELNLWHREYSGY